MQWIKGIIEEKGTKYILLNKPVTYHKWTGLGSINPEYIKYHKLNLEQALAIANNTRSGASFFLLEGKDDLRKELKTELEKEGVYKNIKAVKNDPRALADVPAEQQTWEMCYEAIKQNPECAKYIKGRDADELRVEAEAIKFFKRTEAGRRMLEKHEAGEEPDEVKQWIVSRGWFGAVRYTSEGKKIRRGAATTHPVYSVYVKINGEWVFERRAE
jgi:hypothetical protein